MSYYTSRFCFFNLVEQIKLFVKFFNRSEQSYIMKKKTFEKLYIKFQMGRKISLA